MGQDNAFGQLIRQRRRALDLTQDELARRVGCAAVTLRKIEAGDLRPSQQIAERFAMALAIPLDERADFVRQARAVLPGGRAPEPTPTPQVAPGEIGAEDLSGRAIRGYLLGEKLGAGSFGAVYRGVQPLVERDVAVKIILPQYANHPDFIRRFEAEAQLVARLEHPHIVPLYDYWREPGVAYLVMRLLRGGSLHDLLERGPLSLDQITRLLDQICAALLTAHRAGVIHRDLKPSNVLLDEECNAYLADFGIAKNLGSPDDATQSGLIIGSPAYISPEQINSDPVRPQTDVYSLGVMVYEMLTGARPFSGPTPILLIQQHLYAPMPPLSARREGLPAALDAVIARATAKNLSDRYAEVDHLQRDFQAALNLGQVAIQTRPITPRVPIELVNPYKGLRPFEEADAADFFGRESLTQQLLARLCEGGDLARFLAVIGPSGSGKSSVVGAGLIPALRRGGLPGSENWYIVETLPGPHPLEEIEAALLRIAVNPPQSLLPQIKEDPRGLLRAIQRSLPADETVELVLVLDQFEEVFTLVEDERERALLLDALVAAVLAERSRVRVIITLRADFIDQPLRYVDFAELVQRRLELVLPLTPDEIERAIAGPASRVGLQLESGLVEAITADVIEQPGGLPLLQYALTELYEHRQDHALTKSAYQAVGGVKGALGRRAEEVYAAQDEASQALAKQIFLRLVTLGEGVEDTRRRVARTELESISSQQSAVSNVLDAFGKARLLSFDRDLQTRGPTVEVAHEALLREWPRLHEWLLDSRADVRLQRALNAGAHDWLSAKREASFLLRGSRLQQFEDWARTTAIALTSDERAYLDASLDEREQQRLAEEQRRAREAKLERRAKRVLQGLVAVAVIAAIISGALALLAGNREQEAQNQRQIAEAQKQEADTQRQAALDNLRSSEAQRLAAEANRLLSEGRDNETAALLALRSLQLQYTPQGDEAVTGAARLIYPLRVYQGQTATVRRIVFAPDGKTFLAASEDGVPRLWDLATGQILRQFDGHDTPVFSVAFSPDGRYMLQSSENGPAYLRDVATSQEIRQFPHNAEIWDVNFSPDGKYVLTSSSDKTAKLWGTATGQAVRVFEHPDIVLTAIFSHDGRYILTGCGDAQVRLWEVASGTLIRSFKGHTDWPWALDFSPDDRLIVSGSYDKTARLWDVETGQEVKRLDHASVIMLHATVFSPDGRYILTGSMDNAAHLWDVAAGTEIRQYTHSSTVSGAAFTPDGKHLVTGSYDKIALLWEVEPTTELARIPQQTATVNEIEFSPDGQTILGALYDYTARLWSVQTGQEVQKYAGHAAILEDATFSADGRFLATSGADTTARVWDTATGAQLHVLSGHTQDILGVTFSPDGQYLLTGAMDSTARLWNITLEKELHQFKSENDFLATAFSPDGTRLLVGGCLPPRILMWQAESYEELPTIRVPEGRHCLNSVDVSPDGRYVLGAGIDGVLWMWELTTGNKVREFVGHTGVIWNAAFSRDGKYVISGGADRTARLWDTATGKELRRFIGHKGGLYGAAISPDGKLVATSSDDGRVLLWKTNIVETVDYLCGRLLRDFTADERQRYDISGDQPTCPAR